MQANKLDLKNLPMRFSSRSLTVGVLSLFVLMSCALQSPVRPERAALPDNEVISFPRNLTPRQRIVYAVWLEWGRWGKQTVRDYQDGHSCVVSSPLPFILSGSVQEINTNPNADEVNRSSASCPTYPDGTGVEATLEGCAMAQRYWRIVGKQPDCQEIKTADWAWSAVFISWIMRKAGLNQDQFLTGESHSQYVVDARDNILPSPAFEVQELPAAPHVGDMLCATRSNAARLTQADEIRFGSTPMHCDIVVETDLSTHTLKAIGGNVQQSVSLSTIDTDSHGMVNKVQGSAMPWVLIMRNKLP